jgi:hypothetical protein
LVSPNSSLILTQQVGVYITTHKTKDRVSRIQLIIGDELGCSGMASSAPLVAPVVYLFEENSMHNIR